MNFEYVLWRASVILFRSRCVNTLRLRQSCRHFTDNIFKSILLNENVQISLDIWLKFVPQVPVNNIPALVQIMAWRCPGDKPLSEPMMVSIPTHKCVTRPQMSWDCVFPFSLSLSWCLYQSLCLYHCLYVFIIVLMSLSLSLYCSSCIQDRKPGWSERTTRPWSSIRHYLAISIV